MSPAVQFCKRLAWMIAIWTASVTALLLVSLLIRVAIRNT
jgi:Protein of unknown function (DUF2474)